MTTTTQTNKCNTATETEKACGDGVGVVRVILIATTNSHTQTHYQ